MSNRITRRNIRERREANLINHHLSFQVTVLSVALAMAGLAAASLITRPHKLGFSLVLLWLLWSGSLLAAAMAYAGPMMGAFALPSSIPSIADLLPSLGLSIIEFLMFAVLIHQVTPSSQFDNVFGAWLWLVSAFGCLELIAAIRALYLFRRALSGGIYDSDVRHIIENYSANLSSKTWRFGALNILFVLAGIMWSTGFHQIWLAFLFALAIDAIFVSALISYYKTAHLWRRGLGGI